MPREKSPPSENGSFGERLAALRKDAGLSQRRLAKDSGVSHRMIAYYEKREALPPGHVLSSLAEALSITVDELVGNEPAAKPSRRSSASRRLQRRLQQLEKLPLKDRKALLAIIDTYLERNRLLQRTG